MGGRMWPVQFELATETGSQLSIKHRLMAAQHALEAQKIRCPCKRNETAEFSASGITITTIRHDPPRSAARSTRPTLCALPEAATNCPMPRQECGRPVQLPPHGGRCACRGRLAPSFAPTQGDACGDCARSSGGGCVSHDGALRYGADQRCLTVRATWAHRRVSACCTG